MISGGSHSKPIRDGSTSNAAKKSASTICCRVDRELQPQDAFRYMYEVGGHIYFQDGATLCRLGDDLSREAVCNVPSRIINLVPGRNGELLAAVEHAGMFSIDNEGRVAPLNAATNACWRMPRTCAAGCYNNELLLVGTTRQGLFLINNDGSADTRYPMAVSSTIPRS